MDPEQRLIEAMQSGGYGRILSDSPIHADVWLAYARSGEAARLSVLITPTAETTAAEVAHALRLANAPAPVHVPGLVKVRLTLAELVSAVLPKTRWWCSLATLDPSRRDLAVKRVATIVEAFEAGIKLPPPSTDSGAGLVERIALERSFELASCQAPAPAALMDPGDAIRTIRADAAIRLFQPDCARIRWAVVDSGVNVRCGAFGLASDAPDKLDKSELRRCRVDAVYDFANLAAVLESTHSTDHDCAVGASANGEDAKTKRERLSTLGGRLKAGLDLDWEMLGPLLKLPVGSIPIVDATGKSSDHGTAVAGLLASDGTSGGMLGVCPDLRILDVRVVAPGSSQVAEFDLIAALKFLRFLYARSERPEVHGINLSLQTRHDVGHYACGATPVCEEVNRAVEAGLVVVAAAGNLGYRTVEDVDGVVAPHYFGMTIADPGNAEGAITVGSTHRRDPYRYGVSFFSGKGPTGDGRMKPDIVAPGEKIVVLTATGGVVEDKDGTSYAAPMVSGAAAMLMARNPELIGRPREVKRILMATASDLGRQREFQGAGLLDVLRAMQWGGRGDLDRKDSARLGPDS